MPCVEVSSPYIIFPAQDARVPRHAIAIRRLQAALPCLSQRRVPEAQLAAAAQCVHPVHHVGSAGEYGRMEGQRGTRDDAERRLDLMGGRRLVGAGCASRRQHPRLPIGVLLRQDGQLPQLEVGAHQPLPWLARHHVARAGVGLLRAPGWPARYDRVVTRPRHWRERAAARRMAANDDAVRDGARRAVVERTQTLSVSNVLSERDAPMRRPSGARRLRAAGRSQLRRNRRRLPRSACRPHLAAVHLARVGGAAARVGAVELPRPRAEEEGEQGGRRARQVHEVVVPVQRDVLRAAHPSLQIAGDDREPRPCGALLLELQLWHLSSADVLEKLPLEQHRLQVEPSHERDVRPRDEQREVAGERAARQPGAHAGGQIVARARHQVDEDGEYVSRIAAARRSPRLDAAASLEVFVRTGRVEVGGDDDVEGEVRVGRDEGVAEGVERRAERAHQPHDQDEDGAVSEGRIRRLRRFA
eukprot:CAMPEP_0113271790 /NCGR_PEP_ID=MMETSP0008_2-20120614/22968_1 /TAXON_ID=97485 /ORGANISM="Prymnesium parvum" /LENGTH=471 /DNA_ID=CAMNT_0000121189 /DNA_START=429 /DNA_END=1842 /DNA_ORIENTATION=+ /assembly_acc=CAM_ASM_000153